MYGSLAQYTVMPILAYFVAKILNLPTEFSVGIHNMSGYLVGYVIAKLVGMEEAKRRTIFIEVGLQSGALATSLATQYFSPMAVIPGVVASVYHAISGSLLSNNCSSKSLDKDVVNKESAQTCFEGLKAYRREDGEIVIFRLMWNGRCIITCRQSY